MYPGNPQWALQTCQSEMPTVLLKRHLTQLYKCQASSDGVQNQWTWWCLYGHISHINRELRNNEFETPACHQQICGICPFVRNSVSSAIQCECYCPSNVSSHTPWMLFMYTKDFGLAPTHYRGMQLFSQALQSIPSNYRKPSILFAVSPT